MAKTILRAIDPVCRREVATADAPSCESGGRRWSFCSEACRRRFAADPRRYLARRFEVPAEILAEGEKDAAWWFG